MFAYKQTVVVLTYLTTSIRTLYTVGFGSRVLENPRHSICIWVKRIFLCSASKKFYCVSVLPDIVQRPYNLHICKVIQLMCRSGDIIQIQFPYFTFEMKVFLLKYKFGHDVRISNTPPLSKKTIMYQFIYSVIDSPVIWIIFTNVIIWKSYKEFVTRTKQHNILVMSIL